MPVFKFIAPIHGLDWSEELEGIQLGPFTLSKNPQILNTYTNDYHFVAAVGDITLNTLSRMPFIFFDTSESRMTLSSYIPYIHSYADLILNSFWFLKDNSLFTSTAYIQQAETEMVYRSTRQMFTTAKGTPDLITITTSEYNAYKSILPALTSIHQTDDINLINRIYPPQHNENDIFINMSTNNFMDPSENDKIKRALEFLFFARTNTKTTTKIAFYIAIYECLFSTDDAEISHKVSFRIAKFLSNEKIERLEIYNLVKKAYNIRSRFIHGERSQEDQSRLFIIVEKIDNLTRRILNKIILEEKETFLKTKEELDEWFKDMMLS